MNDTLSSGRTLPYWLEVSRPAFDTPLADVPGVDWCVIGAGIGGLTTAYIAARAGESVIVIDDGEIGSGETGRTTAHLSNALDDRYYRLERLHGERGARLAAESHTAAIDLIEAIVRQESIDCDFERLDGYLIAADDNDENDLLNTELEAAHRAGLRDVRRLPAAPGVLGGRASLRFPRQAQFHPIEYLNGLARAIVAMGGRIHSKVRADSVEDGTPVIVTTTAGRTIRCRHAVVATNTPINERVAIHTKQAAYRTYVVGLDVPTRALPHALWWDTCDPYHYVRVAGRLDGDRELLIVGGEDHKTGHEGDDGAARFDALESWARRHFPVGTRRYEWSGQVMEPADGVAFIGKSPGDEHVYVITGDSGNGMTHGTLAALLIDAVAHGRQSPWSELYDPTRKPPLRALKDYGRENLDVAAQYADWLTGGEVATTDDIVNGAGAIVREGLHKVAAFRDADGALHLRDATCPHLGCIVQWNALEATWDCPCHGSRFDAYGKLLNGPANVDLGAPSSATGKRRARR